jgi:hypothetical protein
MTAFTRQLFLTAVFPLLVSLSLPVAAFSQDSSSRPENLPAASTSPPLPALAPASDAPAAALRDLLAAACAHDEAQFEKFLTARNLESFSRLTPAARIELMKRFVLLDGAGTPTLSASTSGRPAVRCATADGAAELQLGGTDVRDNLALLPIDIRDVSDPGNPQGGDPHHILMGLVRENSSWKILSVGMLFLDLPSLEVEWDRASIGGNEQGALTDLKTIAAAVETYRKTYSRLPESLGKLGKGAKISAESAGLLDPELTGGQHNGYRFRMVIVGANNLGAPAQYELSATPAIYARTGRLSFFRDNNGKYHAGDHQGGIGHSLDPIVE